MIGLLALQSIRPSLIKLHGGTPHFLMLKQISLDPSDPDFLFVTENLITKVFLAWPSIQGKTLRRITECRICEGKA